MLYSCPKPPNRSSRRRKKTTLFLQNETAARQENTNLANPPKISLSPINQVTTPAAAAKVQLQKCNHYDTRSAVAQAHMLLVLKRLNFLMIWSLRSAGTVLSSTTFAFPPYPTTSPPVRSARVRSMASTANSASWSKTWYSMSRSTVAPRLSTLLMKMYSLP